MKIYHITKEKGEGMVDQYDAFFPEVSGAWINTEYGEAVDI